MLGRPGPWPDAVYYIDAATQTSPFNSPPLISPACPASPKTSFFTTTSLPHTAYSHSARRRLDRGEDSASSSNEYMPGTESSCRADVASLRLSSLPSSFGPQRRTGMRVKQPNARTVSLPESLHDEELRLVLSQMMENTTSESIRQSRAVSMPTTSRTAEPPTSPEVLDNPKHKELVPENLHADDDHQLAKSSDSVISSAPSTPRTIVMHSLTSDMFNTPSPPPSSCDSVEFTLEDPELLPDSFLRNNISPSRPIFVPEKASKAAAVLEDDGWITWASSPPRPIPALHGPSSLPYARCPSGAEGTIIEEQSSMPRMIWGLDPNDTAPTLQAALQHQSQSISTKAPNEIMHQESPRAPSAGKSVAASLSSSGSRGESRDLMHQCIQWHQNLKRISAAPGHHPQGRSDSIPRGMTSQGAGLGFTIPGAQFPSRSRHEQDLHSIQCHQERTPEIIRTNFEKMLSVDDEVDKQRQMAIPSMDERCGVRQPTAPHVYSADMGLFTSSSKAFAPDMAMNSRIPQFSRSATDVPGFPPTPPSSSSPQWTSFFSPIKSSQFSAATNFTSSGRDHSANFKMLYKMDTPDDELSRELRRLFLETMSSSNAVDSMTSLRAPSMAHTSSAPAHPFVRPNPSFLGIPARPPDRVLSQASAPLHVLSTMTALSQPSTSTLSTNAYRRSTLSNPRSIPLSRLRQNQKRGAVKLATVPEEAEAPAQDKLLTPPSNRLPNLSRTPSPLTGWLQPQSIEEKTVDEEQAWPNPGTVRVKLPYNRESCGDPSRDLDSNSSATQQESPRKKRPQRRRKLGRLPETERGFPLISEGTVLFGSINADGT